jgi:hypothetical protein
MAKTLKSAAQLTALINAELSKHAVCSHTGAQGIEPIHNWTCKFLRDGSPPSPDCQQMLATVVHELQQKYDLAPEE